MRASMKATSFSAFLIILALALFLSKFLTPTLFQKRFRHTRIMTSSSGKKLIQIDVTIDTVCPWCFVGKKNLDKAMAMSANQFDFQVKWHPFFLIPNAPKEGIDKQEFYRAKVGPRLGQLQAQMTEIFRGLGLQYNLSGLTGNTLDSHRLIFFAGQQGLDKQRNLVEELFLGYFTRGKYIGESEFLVESANKVGVEGAAEFLADPNNGLKEVNEDLKKHSASNTGVPYYVINGKHKLSGGQPPEVFVRTFQAA